MPRRRRRNEEDEDDDDDEYSKRARCSFIEEYAEEADDDDEDDDEDDAEDGFIAPDDEPELEADYRRRDSSTRRPLPPCQEEEDIEEMERMVRERFSRSENYDSGEYYDSGDDERTEADQQALLPSIRDPKLWMVKCLMGRERELAVCLMQKSLDRKDLQILSAIALPSLKNYVYVEAFKEAHVREACKGLRSVFGTAKILLVPVKEMPAVVNVECEAAAGVSRGAWVRVKIGAYKGDLAKVVRVDNVRRQAVLKLIPRIDFDALKAKLDGRDVVKKNKVFRPPQRFLDEEEASVMKLQMKYSKDGFMVLDDMKFKDGFLYKPLSEKSLLIKDIQPTLEELDMFGKNARASDEVASLSEQFASLRKRHFVKNDRVVVLKGDLKNMKGLVEKVDGETVHIKPRGDEGLQMSLTVRQSDLGKCFEPGNQVKAVGGVEEGSTGMVVRVEGNIVTVLSDVTKKFIRVFADDIMETTEVSKQAARLDEEDGDHDHNRDRHRPSQPVATRPPRSATRVAQSGGRFKGGRGSNSLVGSSIRIRVGPHKGCSGIVKEVKGSMVRVELEAQMRNVLVQRDQILETVEGEGSGSRRGRGSETPVHRPQTPLRPCMTPARDYGGATPVHEGMRTPMRHRAWNPYEPMTPTRDVSMYH